MTLQERLDALEGKIKQVRDLLEGLDRQRAQLGTTLLRLEGAYGVVKEMLDHEVLQGKTLVVP